ncbi:FmdB family zinc ribbon protein [Micromonospora sp. RTGN7]|uniref:FmdB family zinc ribbon protein n=1 Tax=Micromonospora sp. RTGN7 TaxID=3016526 RepID=UPI0039B6EE49
MPTYQYACTACGQQLEAVQSFADEPLTECPACEGRLRKVFNSVGVVFKGSGFYRTDSRSDADSAKGGSGADSAKGSSGADPTKGGSGKPAKSDSPSGSDSGSSSSTSGASSGSSGSSTASGSSSSGGAGKAPAASGS